MSNASFYKWRAKYGGRDGSLISQMKAMEDETLLADRACDSDGLHDLLAERRALANIRLIPSRKGLPAFDAELYKKRNHAERFFCNIKHFRAVATRYDKRDDNFLASVQLASLRIWLRTYESVT